MAHSGEYPLLVLPPATSIAPAIRPLRNVGVRNPTKGRQIERLEPQFLALQRVLDAHNAALTQSAGAASPEHVLVFETNGPPQDFFATVAAHAELDWLLEHEQRVDQDDDFYLRDSDRQISACVYLIMFNQKALQELLGLWATYKTSARMPKGLGAWSAVFRCLRSIRRWGPEDRLREADLLRDVIDPVEPNRVVPVEIELWPLPSVRRAVAEAEIRRLVEQSLGALVHTTAIPEIRYHAILVELPNVFVRRLIEARDVELLNVDSIYLFRPTPQCSTTLQVHNKASSMAVAGRATGSPVCALLDGLPMENHPSLQGRLIVDDPDDWAPTYPVADRQHGTAMASLILHGDLAEDLEPLDTPLYTRPILRPHAGYEQAPRRRLWIDLIHTAIRRMVEHDGPEPPVAPTVRIVNLSVGDQSRPFLNEPSPLARLLDWLAWKYQLLFIVSAGNHDTELPSECADDAEALRFAFAQTRHRRILSPGETLNGVTVGALNLDNTPLDETGGQRSIPTRTSLPAVYSALGRGHRRAVKPDLLAPGGRCVFQRKVPMPGAPWIRAAVTKSGHRVALPGEPGRPQDAWRFGTSNAAALTSRSAAIIYKMVERLMQQGTAAAIDRIPATVIVKALLAHTAHWSEETISFVQAALNDMVHPGRAKDQLSGLLGYGVLRAERAIRCTGQRATTVGGGFLEKDQAAQYRFPIPGCLHLHSGWRRLTATLAWFSPINPLDRRYRVARLRMEVPRDSELLVDSGQVHANATVRGTLQHLVLERAGPLISVGPASALDIVISCAEDGGTLTSAIPYAIAVSLEVAPEVGLPIYEQVAARLRVAPRVGVRS